MSSNLSSNLRPNTNRLFNVQNPSKIAEVVALIYVTAGAFSALSVLGISKELEQGKIDTKFAKFFSAWGLILLGVSIGSLIFITINYSYFKKKQNSMFPIVFIIQSILNIVFISMGLVMVNKVMNNPDAKADKLKSYAINIDVIFWILAIINGLCGLGMMWLLFTSKKDFRGGITRSIGEMSRKIPTNRKFF